MPYVHWSLEATMPYVHYLKLIYLYYNNKDYNYIYWKLMHVPI